MVPFPDDDAPAHDDLEELFGETDHPSERTGRKRILRSAKRPVRRWRSSDELDDELEGPAGRRHDDDRRVYWRARDSLWFEPLVALAVIVVLLVSLFAYTSNWPPVYVIESNSMQHGSGDHVGFLNAGDVVLAQKSSQGQIVTYVQAWTSGTPSNYGEPGDVILYHPNGSSSATPVIHRAILFLEYNSGGASYSAPQLAGLPCSSGSHPYYMTTGTTAGCGTQNLTGTLYLYHVGQKDLTITIVFPNCASYLGSHSGFLTLGDNNSGPDQFNQGICGGPVPISTLVEPAWVIGVARGLLPWFGALKLFLDGNAGKVPGASWEFLGLAIAGILIAAAGLHFFLRRLGVRSELRRREEARAERDLARDDEFGGEPVRRSPVRSWRTAPPAEEEEARPRPRVSYEKQRRDHFSPRSRPRRPHAPPDSDEDEADAE